MTEGPKEAGRRASDKTATPVSRNGWLLLLLPLVALTTAAAGWVAVPVVSGLIHTYGVRDVRAEVAWRTVTPEFGDTTRCAKCHGAASDLLHTKQHATVGCQSCHGALNEHEDNPEFGVVTPSSTVCLTCHLDAVGQPEHLATIKLEDHYVTTCLACHNPHSAIAKNPPIVSHKIIDIPTCVTCHGPGQFRQPSMRHPSVTDTTDEECLACHVKGSGPGMKETS